MCQAAGFAPIEIDDQLVPKRAHHHIGIEHMISRELMAAKVAMRASTMEDALRRGEAYRKAGADVLLLSMAHTPEQLRAIAERFGGPLMYLTSRGGLAGMGMTLRDLGGLGDKIVADPQTPLLAAYAAWKKVYQDLADGFGAATTARLDWGLTEGDAGHHRAREAAGGRAGDRGEARERLTPGGRPL